MEPEAFKRCFTQWTDQIREKIVGEIISIDDKTVCGSRSEERKPIRMISAWATEQELVLGQMCVGEKTNEIPTVPLLLDLLDISGCIVTADAMSCQREITKKITSGEGDYVLGLKENQPTVYEYAKTFFKDALEHTVSGLPGAFVYNWRLCVARDQPFIFRNTYVFLALV